MPLDQPPALTVPALPSTNGFTGVPDVGLRWLTITCGTGSVSVNMDDGTVKFTNCKPDEAGEQFWAAVRSMFHIPCPLVVPDHAG
jgi:hypothetical protein